jgi:hypothetical protein
MYNETSITAAPDVAPNSLPTSFRSRTLSPSHDARVGEHEAGDKLAKLVEGLSKLLSDEVAQIKADPAADTTHFANAKAVYMLELSRMMRLGLGLPPREQSRELILLLRQRLCDNQEALRIHLEASRSVAETIKRAIRDAESDGTYRYGAKAEGTGY